MMKLKEMLSSQPVLLVLLCLHHQFSLTDCLPCHSLLVTSDGCACPNGEGPAFGGLVLCSVHCTNDTGCSVVAKTAFSACVTRDHNTSRVVAGLCPLFNIGPTLSFLSLPDDLDELESLCQSFDHTGTLCGSCMANYSLDANSKTGLSINYWYMHGDLLGDVLDFFFTSCTTVSHSGTLPATACLTSVQCSHSCCSDDSSSNKHTNFDIQRTSYWVYFSSKVPQTWCINISLFSMELWLTPPYTTTYRSVCS